MITGQR